MSRHELDIERIGDFAVDPSVPPIDGGSATIFKATNGADELVAIKLFDHPAIESDLLLEYYYRESEALQALDHPNVVKLIAAGKDDALGRHFVALEWLPWTLQNWLIRTPSPVGGWDDLVRDIGIPLLDGIAYSHGRRILHRDVKTGNVLIDPEGTPKLADFGIAKLLDSLRMGLTLRDHGSRPFSPPERAAGKFDERGDLYSFGVLLIDSMGLLTPGFSWADVDFDSFLALREIDLPGVAARDYLERLIAEDPEDRFRSAEQALVALKEHAAKRLPKEKLKVHFFLTRKAESVLVDETGGGQAEQIFREDLEEPAFEWARSANGERTDGLYAIGREFLYHLLPDRALPFRLAVVNVIPLRPSELDIRRDNAAPVDVATALGETVHPEEALRQLNRLRELVAEHERDQRQRRTDQRERELFDAWLEVLEARQGLERRRENPISYRSVAVKGRRVEFISDDELDDTMIDEVRWVSTTGQGRVVGVVEDIIGDRVRFLVERGDTSLLPIRGQLKVDREASNVAIRRERDALLATKQRRTVRSNLADLLVDPARMAPVRQGPSVDFVQSDLDEPQRDAVRAGLGADDFLMVEGPPGTGKTTFIAELIVQHVRRGQKVLLSAQTHVAVDNAIAKVRDLMPDIRMVRVGPDHKLSPEVADLKISAQIERWRSDVQARSQEFFRDWAAAKGLEIDKLQALRDAELAGQLRSQVDEIRERLVATERLEEGLLDVLTDPNADPIEERYTLEDQEKAGLLLDLREQPDPTERLEMVYAHRTRLLAELSRVEAELSSLGSLNVTDIELSRDVPGDSVKKLDRLAKLQAAWIKRFGTTAEFEHALVSVANLVGGTCVGIASVPSVDQAAFDVVILDEASKAAPTEALVPLSKGTRFIIVGDPRQLPPYVDSALYLGDDPLVERSAVLGPTLFDRLLNEAPDSNRVALTVQHRMIEPIGRLVSECFYGGRLKSSRRSSSFTALGVALPMPVVWYSTSRLETRTEDRRGTSFRNRAEVNAILQLLKRIEYLAANQNEVIRVGVISAYAAQRDELDRRIDPDGPSWQALGIDVFSVDAFQGQERDILVYSVTRSNERGDLGFLKSPPRLNVALSRGRDALIIVGDSDFCRAATVRGENPFEPVLAHIGSHPSECILEFLDA